MHSAKINPQIFSEMVSEYFDFLVLEYGYVIQTQAPYDSIAEKDDIRLHLTLERGINPEVYVEFLGQAAQKVGKRNRVDLTRIVDCLYPEVDTKMEFIKERTDIDGMRKNLAKYATLAKNYCAQILAGDLSRWPEIETCMDKLSRELEEWIFGSPKKAG